MIRLFKWLLIISLLSFSRAFSQGFSIKPLSFSNSKVEAFFSNTGDSLDFDNDHNKKLLQETNSSENISSNLGPSFYLHFYGGMGISFFSSSKIKSFFGGDFGIGLGLPTWSWGLISGYKNIVQIEYNNGISDHDFNNNSIIADIPSKVIKMDYETTDWQIKLNPLFWKMANNKAFFIIIGTGDVEWRDKNKDGFSGTSQIFGLEYSKISKFVSWSVSFKRYGVTFNKTILFNIPFDFQTQASDYILEFKIGVGFGI